jgi:regulator of nucleoside diphosphate kinase
MSTNTAFITESDASSLRALIRSRNGSSSSAASPAVSLKNRLAEATIVPDERIPPAVVTMESRFILQDLEGDLSAEYTLVYPGSADFAQGRLNIFAPVGTALLGRHELDTVEWSAPGGLKRFQIVRVLYQPEAAAHMESAS